MKRHRLIIGFVVGLFLLSARPSQAATWLYRPADRADVIGQPVTMLPGTRSVTAAERRRLSSLDGQLQPNYRYHALFTPNDPQFSAQWNFSAINIPAAWDADTIDPTGGGDPRVVVAVLDTGLATAAPDFADLHLWTNPGEIPGDGIDNDHDGLIDDVHGWDFVNNDNAPSDDNGHGTHITGTIAESTNNSLAVAGIAYHTTIMPLKVLDTHGDGTTATITAAINYAAAHGATVINLSLGGTQDDPLLHQAIQAAVDQGLVVVAAAGNDGQATLNYPAVYPETMSVSATQVDSTRPAYANYGPGLDLMAPGGNLNLDQNNDGQVDGILQQTCTNSACTSFNSLYYEGTSQAAAHVSGLAALLAACGEPAGHIAGTLMATATDLGPAGVDPGYGAGLVNAAAALQSAGCSSAAPPAPSALTVVSAAGLTHRLTDGGLYSYRQPLFSWTGASGAVYQVSWQKSGQSALVRSQTATSYEPVVSTEGTYFFSVQTSNALGETSSALTFTYRLRRAVVGVGSSGQVRLYDDTLTKIRQFAGPTGQISLGAGRLSSDQSNRLILSMTDQPSRTAILTTHGQLLHQLQPFGPNFHGRLVSVIVQSVGQPPRLVVGTANLGAEIHWYTASGGSLSRQLIYRTYRGGLDLASGDVTGDGTDELIVAQTAGAEIRVYSAAGGRLAVLTPAGRTYAGGWTVAAADVDGDGHQEIIAVGAGRAGRRPVYALTLHGVVIKRWTLSTAPYDGPIALVGADLTGDGFGRLLVASQSSGSFIQQWSLDGKKQRQVVLAGLRGIDLAILY